MAAWYSSADSGAAMVARDHEGRCNGQKDQMASREPRGDDCCER